MNARRPHVSGIIHLPPDAPRAHGVPIYVRLLEVSQADAPAKVIATQRLDPIEVAGGVRHRFELPIKEVDPRAHYTLEVHVDVDKDGRVGPGDYLTTTSHPVLTFGHSDRVVVDVRRIM